MRLSVIMPVYNEVDTTAEIIRRVCAVPLDIELIVVDDCSTDGTREELPGITGIDHLLFHDRNRGKAAAVRTGLQAVTSDVVTIQDADLEYDPRDLIPMLERIERDGAQVVYGSRILGKNPMSHLSFYLGGRFISLLSNLLYGLRITDETFSMIGGGSFLIADCSKPFSLKHFLDKGSELVQIKGLDP